MTTISTFTYTVPDLEAAADAAKAATVGALVREGLLDEQEADMWARRHTIIYRRKGIFHTFSKIWKDTVENDNFELVVVEVK